MDAKRHCRSFMIPVKRANWPVHYIESGGQSATRRGSLLCEIGIAMERSERSRRKVTGYLSPSRTRSGTHPRPSRGPITMAIAPRQKLNTQNIGENPVILSRLARGHGSGAPLNISLESNLSPFACVILLYGQTVTFLSRL